MGSKPRKLTHLSQSHWSAAAGEQMKEIELVGAASQLGELSPSLLQAAPNEAAAILLCHTHDTPTGQRRVLVREVLHIPQQFYLVTRPDRVSIIQIFLAYAFRRDSEVVSSIIISHTHT